MKKIALFLLSLIAVFSLAACGEEELTLELSETLIELELGESKTLEVTSNLEIEPIFLSLNTGVATVNTSGTISSVGLGSTNIRVTVGETTETVTVKVVPVPVVETEVILTAESVVDSFNDVTLAYGTSLNDALDALPQTTLLYDDEGNTYVVDLAWSIPSYEGMASPLEETDFVASATFNLPEDLEPGDISYEMSMTVSVLPVASEVALNLLNTDPNSASLSTFVEAGVNEVTETNLDAVKAALVVAKNVTLNPGWEPTDIQAVVDNINLNGGTYSVNITLNEDGSLRFLELSTDTRYLKFESEMISEPLLDFFELNYDLLAGQRASFDFNLLSGGNTLNRMNYLELETVDALETNLLIVPKGPLFDNLTINGLNQSLFLDLVIGSNNVTMRNANDVSLILVENAKEINVINSDLISIYNLIDTTMNLDNVMLKKEIGSNPLLSVEMSSDQNTSFFGALLQAPYYLFSQLLISEPEDLINTELSFEYIDLFLISGINGQIFENTSETIDFINTILELAINASSTGILGDSILDSPGPGPEILFLIPTVDSLRSIQNEVKLQLNQSLGENAIERYVYLLENIDEFLPSSVLNDEFSNIFYENNIIANNPILNLNGELEMGDYAAMLGRVNGLDLTSSIKDAEFYIYQGSYLSNFSLGNTIILETGNSNTLPNNDNVITLENGSFFNGLYEINNNLQLLLKGTINGNGAEISSDSYTIQIFVGISELDRIPDGSEYVLNPLNDLGNTSISNLSLDSSSGNNLYVYGENNTINNVTLVSINTSNYLGDVELVINNSRFIDSSYIYLNLGTVTLNNVELQGDMYIDLYNQSTLQLESPLTVIKDYDLGLYLDSEATLNGLNQIRLHTTGILLDQNTVTSNIDDISSAIRPKWQVATASGVYTDLVTASSVNLTANEDGKTLRLVLVNTNTDEEVVVEVLGVVALDALDIENSTVSLDSDASVQAGSNNVVLDLELITSNDLDVLTVTNVAFVVSSAGVILSNQVLNVSSSGTLTFTLTEAGIYEDVTVYVSESGVLTAFDTTFDITVVAATPNAISIVSPTNLTQVGAGASYDIELLVTDIYMNPVPNAVVSLSAVNLNDAGSGFASETMMTETDGTLTATLTIDPVALPMSNISLSFEIDNDSANITNIELFESVSSDSTAFVLDDSVMAGYDVGIEFALVDTKDIPQVITGTKLTMLLVDGNLETGTVVATASGLSYSSTTGSAAFSITTADEYELNLYVETFVGSNEFVLVQSGLEFEVSPDSPDSLEGPIATGSTLDVAAGSTNEMTFTVEDTYGNAIDDEIVTFTLTGNSADSYVDSSNTTSGTLSINSNGEYVFDVVIADNEDFSGSTDLELTLSVSGKGITFTVNLDVNNTLDAIVSSVDDTIEDADIVADTNNIELVVTLVNVSGDAIDTDNLGVYLEMTDNTTLAGVLSGSGITREAIFTVTDTSINTSNLKLYVETYVGSSEYEVIDNDIDLEIVAGNAHDVINLTSSAVDIVMPGDSFTIALTVVDVLGNPVESEDVTLDLIGRLADETVIAGSSSGTSRTLSTNADGIVEWTITIGDNEPFGNFIEIEISINGNIILFDGPLFISIGIDIA